MRKIIHGEKKNENTTYNKECWYYIILFSNSNNIIFNRKTTIQKMKERGIIK